jgi:hypothetical protein
MGQTEKAADVDHADAIIRNHFRVLNCAIESAGGNPVGGAQISIFDPLVVRDAQGLTIMIDGLFKFSRMLENEDALQTWAPRARLYGVKSAADGRFALPILRNASNIAIIVHESGYAFRKWSELEAAPRINLSDWGLVSTQTSSQGRPLADARLCLTVEWNYADGQPPILFRLSAATDKDGQARFTHVPAGRATITRAIVRTFGTHSIGDWVTKTEVDVRSGKESQAFVGSKGRSVIASIAGDKKDKIFRGRIIESQNSSPGPDDQRYEASISPEGKVTAYDIPTGDYLLEITIAKMSGATPESISIMSHSFRVTDDEKKAPLDLGELQQTQNQ